MPLSLTVSLMSNIAYDTAPHPSQVKGGFDVAKMIRQSVEQKKLDASKTPHIEYSTSIICSYCQNHFDAGVGIYRFEDGVKILVEQLCNTCAKAISRTLYYGTFR